MICIKQYIKYIAQIAQKNIYYFEETKNSKNINNFTTKHMIDRMIQNVKTKVVFVYCFRNIDCECERAVVKLSFSRRIQSGNI